MTAIDGRGPDRRAGATRLGIGLAQGFIAAALIESADAAWPKGAPGLFASLVLITAFCPPILLVALGRMRGRTLAVWVAIVAVSCALLAFYGEWRGPADAAANEVWPDPGLIGPLGVLLFIAHHLLEPADVERTWRPAYAERFETAWRHGFQLALSLAFTLIFFGVLHLGGALFELIGIKGFNTLLREAWFVSPVLATAFAGAVHVTDVRTGLIRGLRTVGLTLLSWLLPLMAGLSLAFLVALIFTGVEPLWGTRRAASLLFSAAAVLIVLVNAAYQDGAERETLPLVLRWSGRAAAMLLTPLVILAGWATLLRVGQYGLTPERVAALAVLLVAAVYAGGYAFAALERRAWLQRIEAVNVAAALVIVAVLLALISPLADPARLSAASQAARVEDGKVAPNAFDYDFLRFDAGRFGREALDRLARSPNAEVARLAADAAARSDRRYPARRIGDGSGRPFSGAVVLPAGAVLPESFRTQGFEAGRIGSALCLLEGTACQLHIRDLTGDGVAEVLVATTGDPDIASLMLDAFALQDGRWRRIGGYQASQCAGVAEAFASAQLVAPLAHDLMVGAQRLPFSADVECVAVRAPAGQPEPPKPPPPGGLGPAFERP